MIHKKPVDFDAKSSVKRGVLMVVKGKKKPVKPVTPDRPLPTSRISKIASLKRYEDKEYAKSLLHDIAKMVAPIMHENNFKVGLLCEMYPKSGNLLGLNINKGQKIMLRLRYHSNSRLFLPMGDIVGTMLHELTHNLYGPHNDQFYKFLDKLKDRFEEIQYNPLSVVGYVCEENKVGGRSSQGYYQSIRQKRLEILEKGKYKAESKRLGGNQHKKNITTLRRLAFEAAERRLKDSKSCNSNERPAAEPEENELDIEVIDLTDIQDNSFLSVPENGDNPRGLGPSKQLFPGTLDMPIEID